MSKTMLSMPELLLASRMAWRNDPVPLSLLFVTVNVAASALVVVNAASVAAKTKKAPRSAFSRGRTAGRSLVIFQAYGRINLIILVLKSKVRNRRIRVLNLQRPRLSPTAVQSEEHT